jgi:hypothetical protein
MIDGDVMKFVESRKTKSRDETLFPRWFLFGMGGLVSLSFLEFNVFQVFRTPGNELELIYELGNIQTLLLIIPFVAFVMVPFIDKVNNIANTRPILIRIEKNKVYAKRLDSGFFYECVGGFSQNSEIVSDGGKLSEAIVEVIGECTKNNKVITLAPYIVFTASEPLSKVQRIAAEDAIKSAGALDAKYMEQCLSDEEAWQFVRQNPISFNFA